LPQRCTPRLVEQIARLGTSCVSFAEAQALLRDLLGVVLTSDTIRRITEDAGGQAVALETAEAASLKQSLARPPASLVDRLQQVSVDGAMVPLVGGKWEEVKNLVIGRVEPTSDGPRARALTYFARLADVARFTDEARAEFHRRGTENAREVVAVSDGAEWIPPFMDEHCPLALRIIDWNHAASYVRSAGQALFGVDTPDCVAWTKTYLDLLWEGSPEAVVAELSRLQDRAEEVRKARQYLEKRLDQLRYAAFRAGGYPIGSGIVESANKLVVEARLKGAGKHWARANVDPMLALRCTVASKRWQERWPQVDSALRRPHRHRPAPPLPQPEAVAPPPEPRSPQPALPLTIVNGKPTATHPWKRTRACRAKS